MTILHLPETAFGWMFIPLISGMTIGSLVAARAASGLAPARIIGYGYWLMAIATLWNVGYNYFFAASVPWAVLPLALYAFGLSIAIPAFTVMALELFPDNRGLAASMQSFIQTSIFALVTGMVAPLLFDSAFKLACGVLGILVLSLIPLMLTGLSSRATPRA